jgi:hypothetical protein
MLRLPPTLSRQLTGSWYRSAVGVIVSVVGFFGGLAIALKYPLPTLAICAVILTALVWLRGEAFRGAWETSFSEARTAAGDARETANRLLGAEQDRVKMLSRDLAMYRNRLEDLVDRYKGVIAFEESQIIRYWIGERDDQDAGQMECVTRTIGPSDGTAVEQSLLWRTFSIASTLPAEESSFAAVGFVSESMGTAQRTPLRYLPLEEAKRLRCMVFFDPPIGSEGRTWSCAWRWDGVWGPLRDDGRDSSSFTVTDAPLSRIDIRFIYPSGFEGAFESSPPQGRTELTSEGGRFALRWVLENPQPARYRHIITMQQIRR